MYKVNLMEIVVFVQVKLFLWKNKYVNGKDQWVLKMCLINN